MKTASEAFDWQIARIRAEAKMREWDFAEFLLAFFDNPNTPYTRRLADLLLSGEMREKELIERYRPQFYEQLAGMYIRATNENRISKTQNLAQMAEAVAFAAKQKANLAKGPKKAAEKRTKRAIENRGKLEKAIDDLFRKEDSKGWQMINKQIVSFLIERNFRSTYKDSVIEKTVKEIAARHRKSRK